MIETPRTDAVYNRHWQGGESETLASMWNHANELERENQVMLEALETILHNWCLDEGTHAMRKAKAAIAKAKGE